MRYYNGRSEAWLSLVERRVRDAEAASSNLVASTLLHFISLIEYGLLVKRLRRRPLTAETGVRFPYRLRKPVNLVFTGFFVSQEHTNVCLTATLAVKKRFGVAYHDLLWYTCFVQNELPCQVPAQAGKRESGVSPERSGHCKQRACFIFHCKPYHARRRSTAENCKSGNLLDT